MNKASKKNTHPINHQSITKWTRTTTASHKLKPRKGREEWKRSSNVHVWVWVGVGGCVSTCSLNERVCVVCESRERCGREKKILPSASTNHDISNLVKKNDWKKKNAEESVCFDLDLIK